MSQYEMCLLFIGVVTIVSFSWYQDYNLDRRKKVRITIDHKTNKRNDK